MKKKIVIVLVACIAVIIRFYIVANVFKMPKAFYGFKSVKLLQLRLLLIWV